MKIKVVYNACYGGFGLSIEATKDLAEMGCSCAQEFLDMRVKELEKGRRLALDSFSPDTNQIARHDKHLIKVVKKWGDGAGGSFANLKIATIKGNKYRLDEYDGFETVQTPNDIEWVVVEEIKAKKSKKVQK